MARDSLRRVIKLFNKKKHKIKTIGLWEVFKIWLFGEKLFDVEHPEMETTRLVRRIIQAENALANNEPGADFVLRRLRAELQKQPGVEPCKEASTCSHENWRIHHSSTVDRQNAWRRNCGHGPRP